MAAYSDPTRSGIGRAIRLSVQYALGTGVFAALCVWQREPLWVLPVYGAFLAFLVVRLLAARKTVGIVTGIIAKYEARIAELEK